jgi:hypothetical protein
MEWRLPVSAGQSHAEGFQDPLPEHVAGCFLVSAQSAGHDGRADFRVHPPRHPDFQFDCCNTLEWKRDGHLLRSVFVAAKRELQNRNLLSLTAP